MADEKNLELERLNGALKTMENSLREVTVRLEKADAAATDNAAKLGLSQSKGERLEKELETLRRDNEQLKKRLEVVNNKFGCDTYQY